MAEAEAQRSSTPPPSFLEVKCKSSGKIRRFAEGTEACFAVSLINRKLGKGAPQALYIEAIKEGDDDEEPISFGPSSVLVDYRHGWKLHTVTELDLPGPSGIGNGEKIFQPRSVRPRNVNSSDSSHLGKKAPKPAISYLYIGKIIVAFILMFVLAAIFTLALEKLPILLSFLSSFM
ncbi:hypothetical protein FEM48_Zijuj06G0184800 [Ziziphus jujuba var. spinosa]|uniref:Uncharacterized protein n=1 Tax=Ziziphus jujuba var. spinosa TaxID=714518 RepID=A0A978VAX4_ZIZJJ|nr:hypothetical protein FEM48_Zijuj06G0184800 [Ziziphus jujuba var. spinosa]